VLVLITAAKGSLKLSESKLAMNTIRAYASPDAHVIYGTAYDDELGDQVRVTVVATGLSRQGQRRTAPPLQVLRTGTDNVPFNVPTIHNAVAGPGAIVTRGRCSVRRSRTTATWPCPACGAPTARRRRPRSTRCLRRHGRLRDPGVPAQAGRLRKNLPRGSGRTSGPFFFGVLKSGAERKRRGGPHQKFRPGPFCDFCETFAEAIVAIG
jgi:hypothetical protein